MACRETDIKIKEQQHDIWILLDSETTVVIALSGVTNSNTALTLLKNHAISQMQFDLPLLYIDIVNIS